MGMFDCYEPVPELHCPKPSCRQLLGAWQGKGGPCNLLTWRQGERDPARDDFGSKRLVLPDGPLEIYTTCEHCGLWVDAECIVENGIWTTTRVDQPVAATRTIGEIAREIEKLIENCSFDQDPKLLPALYLLATDYASRLAAGTWPLKPGGISE